MRVLALDTTTRAGSVAIVHDDEVLFAAAGESDRSHTVRLPLDIDRALHAAGLTLDAIDLFAVAPGPGSFTGLRTGIATVQGMAMVTGKPVVAVSALEGLAESARAALPPGARIGAWMDGFRRDVFSALYEVPAAADADLIVIEDAIVEPPEHIWARWTSLTGAGPQFGISGSDPKSGLSGSDPQFGSDPVLIGDGAVKYAHLVAGAARVVAPGPIAAAIGRIGARRGRRGEGLPPSSILPLYVRRPDVEVTRERNQTRGGDLTPHSQKP